MTPQEMIDQVADELRNPKIETKIVRWLNMAIVKTCSLYVFKQLHKYDTVSTVNGTPDITLQSDYHWLKTMQIPIEQRKLVPIDESKLSDGYPDYRTRIGTVQHYYPNGGLTFGLWLVPDAVKTITYAYQRRPTKVVSTIYTSEYSDLPAEWHELICQQVLTKGYDYDRDESNATKSRAEEVRILVKISATLYKRVDQTLVVGAMAGAGRPPRPKFPGHFPRVW